MMSNQRVVIYIKEIFEDVPCLTNELLFTLVVLLYITIHTAWVVPICDTHQHKSRACMRHTTARVQLIRMRQCVLCVAGIVRGLARWLHMYRPFPPFLSPPARQFRVQNTFPQRTSTASESPGGYADKKYRDFRHLKKLSSQKRGGSRGVYQSIRLDLVHNRRCFLGTLKGLIFCFTFSKTGFSIYCSAKKMWSLFLCGVRNQNFKSFRRSKLKLWIWFFHEQKNQKSAHVPEVLWRRSLSIFFS
jgi:hypothetical protein